MEKRTVTLYYRGLFAVPPAAAVQVAVLTCLVENDYSDGQVVVGRNKYLTVYGSLRCISRDLNYSPKVTVCCNLDTFYEILTALRDLQQWCELDNVGVSPGKPLIP